MKHSSPTPTAQALLAESKWLHGLSRSLVIDAASADDLVQDALAAATGYRGPRPSDPRSWATAVLKNLARDRARARSRRAQREAASARPESSPNEPSSSVEAAERQRVLLDAVLSLDEPYRTVVVMRWFDDLSVRAIAKETGRPADTVKKQLQRAHEQLRKKLEARYGGDGAWAVAMLPLAAAKKASLAGAGALSLAAAMAVVAAGTFLSLPWSGGDTLPTSDAKTALVAIEDLSDNGALTALDERGARVPLSATGSTETTAAGHGPSTESAPIAPREPVDPRPHFRGRLFDPAGTPITSESAPGLRLRLTPRADHAGAPAFSRAILLTPDSEGRVMSDKVPGLATETAMISVDGAPLAVLAVGWVGSPHGEADIVLMPAVNLGGTVVDMEGDPVPGVPVRLIARLRALGSYPRQLEELQYAMRFPESWRTTTDAGGRFQLWNVPGKDKFVLSARTAEGATGEVRASSTNTVDVVIRVRDWRGTRMAVTGLVVDDRGFPMAGEKVHLSSEEAVSGDDGRFEIPIGDEQWEFITSRSVCRLWTRSKSGSMATLDVDAESRGPYILRVPSELGRIRGVLRSASGEAVSRAEVFLYDGTRTNNRSTPLEMLNSQPATTRCLTGEDGRFELTSLLDRAYTLRFISKDTRLVYDVERVRPEDLEQQFRVPGGHFIPRFKGRCVDVRGRPLPGLSVTLCAAHSEPNDLPWSWDSSDVAVTDAAGEFTLDEVSRTGLTIRFDGNLEDSRPGPKFDIEDLDPTGSSPIELDPDCTLHLSQVAGSPVAKVHFLDADRNQVNLCEVRANSHNYSRSMRPTEDGTYFPCTVPQSSRLIQMLDREGRVLGETEIDLSPLTLNELTL